MAGDAVKRPSQIQNVPARPSANKQRAGQRPAPRKASPISNSNAGILPSAAPTDPILQARQDAAAAEAEVVKISRAHLAALMASPPRLRMAHLGDPELTPANRTELENSLRAVLPCSVLVASAPFKLAGYPRRLLRACRYKFAVAIILLAGGGVLAGLAWHNTGERMVGTSTTWIIDWRLPDGSIWHGAWKAGLPMIAMRPHNGKVVLRYWLNGRGYATTEVDKNWLLRNSSE